MQNYKAAFRVVISATKASNSPSSSVTLLTQVAVVSLFNVKIMLISAFGLVFRDSFHVGVHSNFTFMLL
jgi:hypothetical protein